MGANVGFQKTTGAKAPISMLNWTLTLVSDIGRDDSNFSFVLSFVSFRPEYLPPTILLLT